MRKEGHTIAYIHMLKPTLERHDKTSFSFQYGPVEANKSDFENWIWDYETLAPRGRGRGRGLTDANATPLGRRGGARGGFSAGQDKDEAQALSDDDEHYGTPENKEKITPEAKRPKPIEVPDIMADIHVEEDDDINKAIKIYEAFIAGEKDILTPIVSKAIDRFNGKTDADADDNVSTISTASAKTKRKAAGKKKKKASDQAIAVWTYTLKSIETITAMIPANCPEDSPGQTLLQSLKQRTEHLRERLSDNPVRIAPLDF